MKGNDCHLPCSRTLKQMAGKDIAFLVSAAQKYPSDVGVGEAEPHRLREQKGSSPSQVSTEPTNDLKGSLTGAM